MATILEIPKLKIPLNSKDKKTLKRVAHSLKANINIGKFNLSDSALKQIGQALADHQLIKVKILETSNLSKEQSVEVIKKSVHCDVVQLIGKTMVLYMPKRDKD